MADAAKNKARYWEEFTEYGYYSMAYPSGLSEAERKSIIEQGVYEGYKILPVSPWWTGWSSDYSAMDLSNIDLTNLGGGSIQHVDFTGSNLSLAQVNSLGRLDGCKLPELSLHSGDSFSGVYLANYCDFTNLTGLTSEIFLTIPGNPTGYFTSAQYEVLKGVLAERNVYNAYVDGIYKSRAQIHEDAGL